MISVQDNMLSGLQTGLLKLNDAHTSTSEQLSEDISAVRQDLGTQADLVASLRSDLETVKKDIADIETLLDESVSVDEMTVGRIAALVSQINDLTKRVEALEEHHTPKDSSSSGSGSTLLLLGLAGAAAALLLGGK
jgi:septal ring factor EnvC (AmiA/AmiB activator)